MSLCFALSFDHLGVMSNSNPNMVAAFANLPISLYSQPGSVIPAIVAGGWLTSNSAVSLVLGIVKTAAWIPPTSTKTWYGVRVKLNAGNLSLATPLVHFGKSAFLLANPLQEIFRLSDISPVAAIGTKEFMLEVGINWETGIIERRVNGDPISSLDSTNWEAGIKAAIAARDLGIFSVLSSNTTAYNLATRDYYLVENGPDNSMKGPLGAIRLAMAENTVVTPTAWTSSTGDVQGVLGTTIKATSDLDTPLLTGAANIPLEIGLKLPAGIGLDAIRATVSYVSAGLSAGVGATIGAELKSGSSVIPGVSVPLVETIRHGKILAIGEKAPDGTAWNKAKLEATKLVLTCV